ncbi:MAG: Hsp20/alpha crystallin family protein [Candidatus Abyssobacteria bacterium SURF_5]|uniref:Hsp20/alpha crystallin family protein n=1 Tax=Abyssobacteria bacterium (strain SURF_5) TaxID=2093360 RepID=A0A3A4NRQ1_ABYX5|nr:MAG: Hsp20/alpha crystallin family protein [Candidatus Abyssubacteria bacterium SURF_5]
MALVRWRPGFELEPFRNLMRIQDEINRLFDLSLGFPERRGIEAEWAPAVDVYEDENNIFVKAELPGLTDKDIDVNVIDSNLVIKGEKKKEEERKEKNYYRIERTYGAFQRSIPLPTAVDTEKVKASFKSGILEIEMPKKEEAKPKQIKVKTE